MHQTAMAEAGRAAPLLLGDSFPRCSLYVRKFVCVVVLALLNGLFVHRKLGIKMKSIGAACALARLSFTRCIY